MVDALKGEAFGFLGFDLRRSPKRKGNGHYIQMTPKKKARKAIKQGNRIWNLAGTSIGTSAKRSGGRS